MQHLVGWTTHMEKTRYSRNMWVPWQQGHNCNPSSCMWSSTKYYSNYATYFMNCFKSRAEFKEYSSKSCNFLCMLHYIWEKCCLAYALLLCLFSYIWTDGIIALLAKLLNIHLLLAWVLLSSWLGFGINFSIALIFSLKKFAAPVSFSWKQTFLEYFFLCFK